MDEQTIINIIDEFKNVLSSGSWYAITGAAVMMAIRLYRLQAVQNILPIVAKWDNLKPWVRYTIVFTASLVGSICAGLTSGVALKSLLVAAIVHAISTTFHKSTQAVGQKALQLKVNKDPLYEPSVFRDASSIILPFDENKIERKEITSK